MLDYNRNRQERKRGEIVRVRRYAIPDPKDKPYKSRPFVHRETTAICATFMDSINTFLSGDSRVAS